MFLKLNPALLVFFLLLLLMPSALCSCSDEDNVTAQSAVSSQSYRGHENDSDSNNLVKVYPHLVGTRVDDCQTCHTGASVEMESRGEVTSVSMNPCAYCHLIPYPDDAVLSGAPTGYEQTLNPFGLDYKNAGRDRPALTSIAAEDSDGDGFDNATELESATYPGDASSQPGQQVVPYHTYEWADLTGRAAHDQFLLLNSHKQEFDNYARYVGVKVVDLLSDLGATLTDETSISFIAPDGYVKDFTYAEMAGAFPAGLYFANLDAGGFTDPEQGFVTYPASEQLPAGLVDGGEIPGEQWIMLAYRRDGSEMDQSYLDPVSGRLEGEGPYRLIVPQRDPGSPDRGSKYSPSGYEDGWDYDDSKDHNAGHCVRGVVAIRVNPLPEGYEEFDWKNGGFSLLEKKQLIIYGAGIDAQ
jgi:hypothetical protein